MPTTLLQALLLASLVDVLDEPGSDVHGKDLAAGAHFPGEQPGKEVGSRADVRHDQAGLSLQALTMSQQTRKRSASDKMTKG
jgi:hypothetical protein